MSIELFAENARIARDRKILSNMAEMARQHADDVASMPEWAKACAIDTRVPVSVKVEHDSLSVDTWTSKSGNEMHRVHWADGTVTQYDGDLSRRFVEWDR